MLQQWNSLRSRLSIGITLGLLVACVIAATQILSFWTSRTLLVKQIREREIDKIDTVAEFLKKLIGQQTLRITAIAKLTAESERLLQSMREAPPYDKPAIAATIEALKRRAKTDLIEITDRHETVLYQANAPNRPEHPSTLWGVAEALEGRSTQTSAVSQDGVTIFAIEPVQDGKKIIGTLAVGLPFDTAFVRELSHEIHAGLALVRRSGEVVAMSGMDGPIDHKAVEEAFLEKIPIYRQDASSHQTYAYIPILIIDEAFVVLAQIDSQHAYNMLLRGTRLSALSALAIFAGSASLGFIVIQCILRPLSRLRHYAETIGVRYLDESITAKYKDEIMAAVQVIGRLTRRLLHKNRELLRLNKKLTSLDRTKSEFVSSVSHELRTPLTSILGFTKIIRRDVLKIVTLQTGQLPEAKRVHLSNRLVSNLDIITGESMRLTAMINDILDLAKIESGTLQWNDQDVIVSELIQQTADAALGLVESKPEVHFRANVETSLPPVCVDPDRMRQVLLNLLANAFKFTPQGSVELMATWAESAVRFHVADSGIGIPPEEMPLIFDRFYQASSNASLTGKPQGTGLGLSITRSILAHYNSEISVSPRDGGGSIFWFDIPVKSPRNPPYTEKS